MILQELCIVCKGYIENKNERTLLIYSFVIDAIKLQADLYKRRFFMSYMSMTIYNIYSFLFIIVNIVCIIIYLLILYVGILVFAKAREVTRTNW